MPAFTPRQRKFLNDHELCRFATASKDGAPHVVPVIYTLDGDDVVIAIDYKTKKWKNLRENRRVAFVVDEYSPNRGLMVEGEAETFERGKEYLRLLQILFDRFAFYRNDPWGEGESPILKVHVSKCVMW